MQPNPPRRQVDLGNPDIDVREVDGVWHVDAITPLAPYPVRFTDRLVDGARLHPERTVVAARGADGAWIRIGYGDMLQRVRRIAQALRLRDLGPERPLVILSGNDLEHYQLALGALYAGVAYAPLSPAYSLAARAPSRLAGLLDHLTPGAVFAADGEAYAGAIAATLPPGCELILARGAAPGHAATAFASLLATEPGDIDAHNAAVDGETIAKFLFTSGSTRAPKAVITTHRMLCSNQQMLLQTFPFLGREAPVLVDWLPWNHTFGGSHNIGIALYNGGTLYIDDGRPTPRDIEATVRNLREIAPTMYLNVPAGLELLAEALERDGALRERFLSRLKLVFCAGAGLSQAAWERLDRIALRHCGESIRIMTGLGMTETAPACTFGTGPVARAGYVGVPAPGCRVKLAPAGAKFEARFAGPNVTPGYWRAPALTAQAFDADGYYRTGDALRFADPAAPGLGFMFDGRIAEDFKLANGTFVSVGALRARAVSLGAPYVQDVVVTGIDRAAVGMLVFPRMEQCRALAGLKADTPAPEVLASAPLRAMFQDLLERLNRDAGGAATRVERLLPLAEPASLDHQELTDKGSINQNAVLARRAALVEAMYAGGAPLALVASAMPERARTR